MTASPTSWNTPEMVLLLSEEVAVFDNLAGRLFLVVNVDPLEPAPGNSRTETAGRTGASPVNRQYGLRRCRCGMTAVDGI